MTVETALPQPRPPYFMGVDVGGTNLKVGVVDDLGQPLAYIRIPTDAARGPEAGVDNIARAAKLALDKCGLTSRDIRGVGLATPGTMDIPQGLLLAPPNLPGWNDFPIRHRIAERLQLPTILQNDANAAAYGEYWAGAAKEAASLVMWTLGTGIGCGIIIGNLIVEGAHSHGAEGGHIIVEMHNGRRCDTGQYGTLEAYAGAKALVRRCEEALAAGRRSSLGQRRASEVLTPLMIGAAADAGDELARELVLETARYMGVGTTSLMHTIDPEMVLIGGAMTFGGNATPLGRSFIQEIRNEVHQRAFPVPAAQTRIEYAGLGGDAGFTGAAGCARLKFGDR